MPLNSGVRRQVFESERVAIIKYLAYMKLSALVISTSAFSVGVVLAAILAAMGGFSMNLNAGVDLSSFDGVWLALGVPVLALVLAVLVSPLSYLLFKQLRRDVEDEPP